MIAGSGRRVFRTGGLTAGRGFHVQAGYGSLRRGGSPGLLPGHRRAVLPAEAFRHRQDPAGQGVGRFPWLRVKPKRLEAWNTSPKRFCAGGRIRQVRLPQGDPPLQPERVSGGGAEQDSGPDPGRRVLERGPAALAVFR